MNNGDIYRDEATEYDYNDASNKAVEDNKYDQADNGETMEDEYDGDDAIQAWKKYPILAAELPRGNFPENLVLGGNFCDKITVF